MNEIKVLGRVTSTNVRKVLWLAGELGLAVEREDWGLPLRDPHAPQFLALNPNAQVPVLIDGDFVLWESNAILAYLARRESSPLLPSEPQAQGQVEQWLYWQLGELNPAWSYAVQHLIRRNPAFSDPVRIAQSITAWTAKMEILEGQLARTDAYVAGEAFSIADIALGVSVHRWLSADFERKALPAVAAYYQRLKARPAAQPWLTPEMP